MPIFEAESPDGTKLRYHTEQGFTYPEALVLGAVPAKDLKLQLQWIKEMDVRDDDIMICAYPKTGTHWLWEVLSMLAKEHAKYETKSKEYAMLEFQTKEMKQLGMNGKILFSQHVRTFIAGKVTPCDYFWYMKEFEKFKEYNPDYPLLNVFYEDMILQPEKEIKKLATFLGKSISDELAADIAEKCKFDNMKKANEEVKDDFVKQLTNDGNSSMYRKGKIGDWKNHFTVAENEMFEKWFEEQSKDFDIKFIYE